MSQTTLEILLVEDSEADILLAEMAFMELDVPHRLHIARDGIDALGYLGQQGVRPDCPRPDLILLDLNMPRMGGLEFLREIKVHPEWRSIPVIVLTTSSAEGDVWESYHRYANAYMNKPTSLEQFVENMRHLSVFWRAVATLPPERPPGA
ncbi:response regulator [Deinococcus peraridilitoris]|uniref:CheY-like receiver domain-containing protein n=1 Tax=Deinococcus peraridilitoris (strain DSM 19664 / LMG 22246 / CIP 109416 / KR-200) TaxID=937777 RepID=L0A3V6_DEIPD|nr:response regulator [Deinococcus peraridilitoris]AFZ68531.1 CheY-like receiver domain-containing protein [Deinococcus peraridilitoris DSM 19664]